MPIAEVCTLEPGEEVVSLVSLADDTPTLAIGTANGVVKRLAPGDAPNRDAWEVIALKDGDTVVGATPVADADELVFVSSDSSLLRFSASAVRPQGRTAAGMAGIRLAPGQKVVHFGGIAADGPASAVVTIAGASDALPGTETGSVKTTPFDLYPAKGRATGGVRTQRFLRGEDTLVLAWVGVAPPHATGSAGQPVELPEPDPRRDASGVALRRRSSRSADRAAHLAVASGRRGQVSLD